MKSKRYLFVTVLLVLGLLITACGAATPEATQAPQATVPPTEPPAAAQPSGEPIKIGAITSLSGFVAAFGQEEMKGAELAVKMLNDQGGLLGRPVELLQRDDKVQPDQAAKHAENLIANEKVDMLTGCVSGAVTVAINEVAKRAGVLYLGTCQTSSLNTVEGMGPYTFHLAFTPWMNTHLYTPWMVETLGTKILFLYYDFIVGHESLEGLEHTLAARGQEIDTLIPIPLGTTDYTAIIPQIRAAKPEVLHYFVSGSDRAAFLKQATSFGLQSEMEFVALAADLAWDLEAGFANSQGDYAPANFYWELRDSSPTAKAFVDAFGEKYGYPPSGYAAYQYQAIMAWADAVTKAGSVDPDDVAAALEGLEFDHGSGPAYIRACDHQLFQPIHITKMRSEDEASQSPLWPEYAFREVLTTIDVTEDIERTCEELGFTD
jgi:branched-chain amino acid transport system substrate-binding protein